MQYLYAPRYTWDVADPQVLTLEAPDTNPVPVQIETVMYTDVLTDDEPDDTLFYNFDIGPLVAPQGEVIMQFHWSIPAGGSTYLFEVIARVYADGGDPRAGAKRIDGTFCTRVEGGDIESLLSYLAAEGEENTAVSGTETFVVPQTTAEGHPVKFLTFQITTGAGNTNRPLDWAVTL